MATPWSAATCMGMSFHESPTVQVSIVSPSWAPPGPVSRSTSRLSPAPLDAPAGMRSRKSWLRAPSMTPPQRRATSASMRSVAAVFPRCRGMPTTARPARSAVVPRLNRVSRSVLEPRVSWSWRSPASVVAKIVIRSSRPSTSRTSSMRPSGMVRASMTPARPSVRTAPV